MMERREDADEMMRMGGKSSSLDFQWGWGPKKRREKVREN